MGENEFVYVIVGGGLAGASAVEGIRQVDKSGSLLLVGSEKQLPYHRPPLSKKLWTGQLQPGDIFVHDQGFFDSNGVTLALGAAVVGIDPVARTVSDDLGNTYRFGKLLLATGGVPRRLTIPGGDAEGICYLRNLDDYLRLRGQTAGGASAVVIGGGFIGSEIAAALNVNKVAVTMVFPSPYLCSRVFPAELGNVIQEQYRRHGIEVASADRTESISRPGQRFITRTQNGRQFESDMLIAGVGLAPDLTLARSAGLKTGDGIVVNEWLQTSHPDIYAAGDNALFPYQALGRQMRVEHWDNAMNQGRTAGRNMAGVGESYTHMPYFFSDLFEFGYEAVGEISSELETYADWQKPNDTGVIYYLRDGRVRGAMMCNVWNKVEQARQMIRGGAKVAPRALAGAIR